MASIEAQAIAAAERAEAELARLAAIEERLGRIEENQELILEALTGGTPKPAAEPEAPAEETKPAEPEKTAEDPKADDPAPTEPAKETPVDPPADPKAPAATKTPAPIKLS